MREILSAEQPCIFCGQLLEVVTILYDDALRKKRIDRERVDHDDEQCISFLRLMQETWPEASRLPL